MRRLKQITLSLILALFAFTPVLAFDTVHAQISEASRNAACEGIGAGSGNQCTDTAGAGIGGLIRVVIDIMSWITGLASMIMLIIGGFKFITSSGDSSKVSSARTTIIYALVGVAVVVLAQVLVSFVVTETSTDRSAEVQACRDALPESEWHTCN